MVVSCSDRGSTPRSSTLFLKKQKVSSIRRSSVFFQIYNKTIHTVLIFNDYVVKYLVEC